MKYVLMAIQDTKSGLFTNPIPFRTVEEAIRGYSAAIPSDQMLRQYPEDFVIAKIGEWDNESGVLSYAPHIVGTVDKICKVNCNANSVVAAPISEEVSAPQSAGFPVQEIASQECETVDDESFVGEQKRRFVFGGPKK